jgi:hypothetical protein
MNMKTFRRPLAIAALAIGGFFVLTAESCQDDQAPQPTANQREQAAQASITAEAQQTVGMPNIINFNQKKQLKAIIEAFDQPNLITYSYVMSMTGKAVPLCRSQGYGFNEATQFTNPLAIEWREGHGNDTSWASGVVGQADPTGLYSPTSSAGTLLMCLTTAGKVLPVRSEPDILTLPVPYDQLDRTGM